MREGNDGNLLRYDDITFLGQDPNGVTMNAVESLLKQHGYYTKVDEASNVDDIVGGSLHFVSDDGFESVLGNMIRISSDDGSKISNLFYSNVGEEESLLDIGIRGICLSDSLETALSKLGFSNAVEIASWVYTHEFASIEEELATDSWYYRSNNGPVYIYWRADRADSPDSHDVLELSVAVQPDDAWLDYEAWIQRQGYLGYSDRRITLRFLWNGGLKTAFVYP